MRVYTHPNLLQTVGASITSDTSTCTAGNQADNLVNNLGIRGCSYIWDPLIDELTPTTNFNSCLNSDESLLTADGGNNFVLGFELNSNSFVHKILYVEGHESWASENWESLSGHDD